MQASRHIENRIRKSAMAMDRMMENRLSRFRKLSARERAYEVVRSYMSVEKPSSGLRDSFIDWLIEEQNAEAKDWALRQVFEDMLRENKFCDVES